MSQYRKEVEEVWEKCNRVPSVSTNSLEHTSSTVTYWYLKGNTPF